ncbi:regulatory protein RecX [Kaarinaea lacus]
MSDLVLPDVQHKEIRRKAMDLLARREHSVAELRRKLLAKGYAQIEVDEQLLKLEQENLLSDQRFTESYVNFRSKKGFGPLRIEQELKERGIGNALLEEYLDNKDYWRNIAKEVREKRFGTSMPQDYKDKVRQLRFLQYRGFSQDQLRYLFDSE